MNIADSEKKWGKTKTAIFSARRARVDGYEPSVYVYPRKGKSGFVWIIWHSYGFANIDRSIKCGGITNLPRRKACQLACNKLLAYRGRAVGAPRKLERKR